MATPRLTAASAATFRSVRLDSPARVARAIALLIGEAIRQGGIEPASTIAASSARIVIFRAGKAVARASPLG